MGQKLKIDRVEEPGSTKLTLKGVIDEDADFDAAFANVKPTVMVNLEGIEMINSCGVREWVHAIQAFPKSAKVIYEKLAPRIVEQVNYVANFLGHGKIASFYAPYFCPKCKKEENVLLSTEAIAKSFSGKAPSEKCPTCKSAMEFDDIEEEYFSFLEDL